ncbi:MAG: Flp pilus assembly complex ATPase component TadA [Cytophagales bacterium]|nr:Flp pilus assembly complex ATPase component TadA [Armatimonadota bacterium]
MRVLIAEDDSTSALVLRRSLEKLGHEVTLAVDGEEAWGVLTPLENEPTPRFDVVISDWMMPKLDGPSLTRRIRAAAPASASGVPALPYLYVILLTARGTPEDRIEGLTAGADDFLVKPLDQADLVARLEVARRILALQADAQANSYRMERLRGQLERNTRPIGEILVAEGVISGDQLRFALEQQTRTGQPLGPTLIANGWATEEHMTYARSVQIDVPYVAVSEETPDPELLQLIPQEIAQRHLLLPLSLRQGVLGEAVRVAVVNPWNVEGLDLVARLTGKRADPLMAAESSLRAAIEAVYRDAEKQRQSAQLFDALAQSEEDLLTAVLDDKDGMRRLQNTDDLDATATAGGLEDEAPVIRLINGLLAEAVRRRASDVHIEPYKTDFEVRYRIDGELHVVRTLPRASLAPFTSRLKVMAELDISERRLPQDGRIAMKVDGKGVDMRVSSLPTQFGERIVLRVLDRSSARLSLDDLQFSRSNDRAFKSLIKKPYGIILVTGPTGSGKTTTLYASLNALRSPSTNIMTCEDPIEYELDRISQSAVNVTAGLTVAGQLRAILRQDPDVVLVGEIRDAETAEVAFRAALTGHLVLSTLHCNEAAGAPTRLIDMGVPPFLIASSLIGVVAQRLVKKLCPACRREVPNPDRGRGLLMEAITGRPFPVGASLWEPVGCPECAMTGTRGRIAIHELLSMDDRIQSLIMKQEETRSLREAARENGMISMAEDGVEKAIRGLTTLEEVEKKVGASYGELPPPLGAIPIPTVLAPASGMTATGAARGQQGHSGNGSSLSGTPDATVSRLP